MTSTFHPHRIHPWSPWLHLCLFLSIISQYVCVDLTYYLEEGKSPGTLVGDVASDSHLMDSVLPQDRTQIQFTQLQQDESSNSQWFRIAKKTGKLYTAQTLNAESLCGHNPECFQIVKIAVRHAETFMKILKVKVVIQDVNDYQPEFPVKQENIQFSEGDKKGTKVSIPNAVDRDVGVRNSQITYQLKKDMNEPFTLSVSKSVDETFDLSIILEDTLDREIKDSYTIQVVAKDGGSPPKQSILDVHISVTDVNDNAPVFSQNVYNVSIKYEHDEATPVAILSARDTDAGKNGKVSYHFSSKTSEEAQDAFRLNEETGEIFLHKRFTVRQKLTYRLYVKATDGGNLPLSSTAKVQVNVINQQNNAPIINVNFVSASTKNTATISEDVDVGSFIAYVMVSDYDLDQNGQVSCNLHHSKFQLQSLGKKEWKVIVKKPLDRETEDHHELTIVCQDKGSPPLHSESKFSIQVLDVNDVQPQLLKETFKFWIYENQKPNFIVGSINATDPDLKPGGKLTYSLLSDRKHFLPFQISNTGVISTVMSLDYEFQNMYRFRVLVKDNGIPSLNSTANIIIEVRDENDNAPYFTFPSINPYTMDVVYYPHHTNNITVLRASDSDSRENAFLRYEIIAGNEEQIFNLNHYTGLLSFTRVVTQQDAGSYELAFVVKDSGDPVLSATTNLSLTLTVSNKTFEMINTVHMKSEEKIQLYIMVVIVVVAVILSVPITAAISICIIRFRDRRNDQHSDSTNPPCKCVTEHGNYMCPSQQATYWPDDIVAQSNDPELTRSLSRRSRRGPHPAEELAGDQNLRTKFQADGVCQICSPPPHTINYAHH